MFILKPEEHAKKIKVSSKNYHFYILLVMSLNFKCYFWYVQTVCKIEWPAAQAFF